MFFVMWPIETFRVGHVAEKRVSTRNAILNLRKAVPIEKLFLAKTQAILSPCHDETCWHWAGHGHVRHQEDFTWPGICICICNEEDSTLASKVPLS